MTSMTGYRGPAGSSSGQNMTGNNMMSSPRKPKAPSGYKSFEQFTPDQMQLFQQLFSHVGPQSYLSRLAGGDESLFQQMEAPAFRQFDELMGQYASRFSGMGMGARKGSGFQNSTNAATSNFAQDLMARRQSLQQQ